MAFFCFGMAKKMLLANPCGKVADMAFDAGSVGTADAWFGVVGYAFQIYFDFCGYSDMAIGLGLMLGLRLREELRFAVPVAVDHRVLAALAHLALHLAARLPLRAARRQPQGAGAHLRQPDDGDAARRPLARGLLELRDLGRYPRRDAGLRADAGQGERLPEAARDR